MDILDKTSLSNLTENSTKNSIYILNREQNSMNFNGFGVFSDFTANAIIMSVSGSMMVIS